LLKSSCNKALDSFKILQELWASPGLRASLVGETEAILKEASGILSVQGGTAQSSGPSAAPQILGSAMKKLVDKEKEATSGLGTVPSSFNSLDEAANWLRTKLSGDETHKERLIAEYKNLMLTELQEHAEKIKQVLTKTGFQLIPTPYPGLHYGGLSNILGILVYAGFLSLGAPFWFNALKNLSNLRPLVAIRQEKEQQG
jgi:hypothetical protein